MDMNSKIGNIKVSQLLIVAVASLLCLIVISIVEHFVVLSYIYRFVVWMCIYIPVSLGLSKLYGIYTRTKSSN
jgi:hypothetical protein